MLNYTIIITILEVSLLQNVKMATADENLRSQFQLLQDQQQKKLMRRKQRKEEQRAKTASVLSTKTQDNAFGVSDQLDLKVNTCGILRQRI